jgi:hypothetical protein
MSTQEFQGNIPVSTAKHVFRGLDLGRDDFIKQAIMDKGLQIREEGDHPVRENSQILGKEFPEEAAVKGLVHDASVNLYSREPGFRNLDADPSAEEILGILEGSVKGTVQATSEVRNRVNSLETQYGIAPDEILDYEFDSGSFGGHTVSDLLEAVAEYRHENWVDDTFGFMGVKPEETVFADGLSGRIDLLYMGSGDIPDQIGEIKMGEEPSRYDEFQTSAYWLMNGDEGARAMIDYPSIDERLTFNPDEETNDFDPREYAFDVYRSRDAAEKAIEELRGLQHEYFKLYDSRERATREALRDMEVM